MRHLLDNSEIYIIVIILTFAVYLTGGINFSRVNPQDLSGAALAMVAPTPNPNTNGLQIFSLTALKGPGIHGAFIASSVSDVDLAAQNGMSYIISYDPSVFAAGSSVGQALLAHNMKAYMTLFSAISYQPGTCVITSGDLQNAKNLITNNYQSPIFGGYWIKDDDVRDSAGNYCDMKPALQQLHDLIRSIDPDPSHLILAGYGEPVGLQHNYTYGIADVIFFYPYPHYDGGTANVANTLIPQMAQLVQQDQLPTGKTPPPIVGVYQAFEGQRYSFSDCHTPIADVVEQLQPSDIDAVLQAYQQIHVTGVAAFSMGPACDVHQTAGNDPAMLSLVQEAWSWIQKNQLQ